MSFDARRVVSCLPRLSQAGTIFLLVMAGCFSAYGVSDSGSIEVKARALAPVSLEVIDDRIDFGLVNPGQTIAVVNPTSSEEAAVLRVSGTPGFGIRIDFPEEVILAPVHFPSAAPLLMKTLLSGRRTNGQSGSTNLNGPPARASLSQTGEYFIWAGGQIEDLDSLQTGDYEGFFTITVEYDL